MSDELNLSNLKPAQPRRDRKRIGRGMGSGKGRYAGRGVKGQKSRSGSNKMRTGFEGGQTPIYRRLGKRRGNTSQDAYPVGPFRTRTVPVNLRDLETRFDEGTEVTPDALVAAGVIKNTRVDVKILGEGDLTKRLTVTAHRFSASARAKIEQAGGTVVALREEEPSAERPKQAPETDEAAAAETVAAAKGEVGEPDEAVDEAAEGAAKAAEGEG